MEHDTSERLLFFGFLLYVLVLLGVQTGHLFWLLTIHTDLRDAYDLDPLTGRHTWGFAGAAFLLIMIVAGPFCVLSFVRKYGQVQCTWLGGRQWIMFFWPISLAIYNGQVIVFLVSTVNLYLDLKWGSGLATCACHQDVDPLLNVSVPLDHCQCLVPKEDCAYQITACYSGEITDTDLGRRGSQYSGNVSILQMSSLEQVNQWAEKANFDRNFQYMLVLIKASALVTVLHFPLWLLDHYLIQMAASIKGDTDPDESSDPDISTRKKISEIVSELMVHTVYCFSENIDGFSLLDEYLETANYFWRNGYLRDAVLAFIGTNIILVAGYNGVTRLLQGYTLVSLIVRCLIVVLNNLPFMIIRIYMLWTLGGDHILDQQSNTNLFFFVSKEAVFLVVYIMECGFSIYQYRVDKKNETNYSVDEAGSTIMTGGNEAQYTGVDDPHVDSIDTAIHPTRMKRKKPKPPLQDPYLEDDLATTNDFPMNSNFAENAKFTSTKRNRPRNRENIEDPDSNYSNNMYISSMRKSSRKQPRI